ncbi:MAG: hypothetical protein ACT4QG_07710 [Sporichthyaceae bacterium]
MTCQDALVVDELNDEPRTDPWYRARRAIVGMASAVVLVVVGAGVLGTRVFGGPGPVPVEKPRFSNVLPTAKPGQDVFSAGFMAIRDKGKDIEILKVEANTTPNVEYVDTGAQWPRDVEANRTNPGNNFGFPLSFRGQVQRQHPAIGVTIPAEELDYVPTWWDSDQKPALWVIVGFRLTSGDVGAVNGIRVTYKFGGKTKRQFFEHAVIVCKAGNDLCRKGNPGRYGEHVLTEFGLVPKGTY